MTSMESTLSIIATIVSSVALIGVAIGLILQCRQLRANQIQIMRGMHLELLKIGIDNPALAASVYGSQNLDSAQLSRDTLINFLVKFWETGYSLKTITRKSVELQANWLFKSENARTWWTAGARDAYQIEAGTKLEREFFAVLDSAFRDAVQALQSVGRSDAHVSSGEA